MKKTILKKNCFSNLKNPSLDKLKVIIKYIEYCKNINTPEILIDNKNEVAKERHNILTNEMLCLLWAFRKILVDK